MIRLAQWLSVTGLVINVFAALFLLVPELPPGRVKSRIHSMVLPVRQLESAYYKFTSKFQFESDPRVLYYGEGTPHWLHIDSSQPLEEAELNIIANILLYSTWRWTTIDCIDFCISEDVDLPEPQLKDIWSRNTFEFNVLTQDGATMAYYPINDWTRKQLYDGKSSAVSQIYTLIGALCLLTGFFLQVWSYWVSP